MSDIVNLCNWCIFLCYSLDSGNLVINYDLQVKFDSIFSFGKIVAIKLLAIVYNCNALWFFRLVLLVYLTCYPPRIK